MDFSSWENMLGLANPALYKTTCMHTYITTLQCTYTVTVMYTASDLFLLFVMFLFGINIITYNYSSALFTALRRGS